MNGYQHFQRGHGAVLFTCCSCGRRTRHTGQGQDSEMCYECWELAGWQNSIWDGTPLTEVVTERDRLLSVISKRGGDTNKVRSGFADLFNGS